MNHLEMTASQLADALYEGKTTSAYILAAVNMLRQKDADDARHMRELTAYQTTVDNLRAELAALKAAQAGPVTKADPLDALRWGANVAETLLSIGRAIGFGRAQQILGEQWEAVHNCAPRGRMGVTVKDDTQSADALDAARWRGFCGSAIKGDGSIVDRMAFANAGKPDPTTVEEVSAIFDAAIAAIAASAAKGGDAC